jgi:starch synthase
MARPLNVLLLSSEVEPFAKTGGLADVSSALPKSIKALDHEVRVMMPRYGSINAGKLHDMIRLKDVPVPVGTKQLLTSVKSSFLSNSHSKVQVYFLDNHSLFGRSGLYVHPDTKKDYEDNDVRFIFFARGTLEVLKRLGWQPDIIHCNDWPTGLVPVYLRTIYKDDPFYKDTRTVFTIHNMAYQGIFPKSSFAKTGLPDKVFGTQGIESGGKLNLLKAGLLYSDAITTVSERYAKEIQDSEEYGCGLQDFVRKRRNDLSGILNGIDYSLWDPSTDEKIPHRYNFKTLDLKLENKKALLQKLGLPFTESVPVIGMVTRLAEQKGIDILMEVFDTMMGLPVQFVALGVGEKRYHDFFENAQGKYRDKVSARLVFDSEVWDCANCPCHRRTRRHCGGLQPVNRERNGLQVYELLRGRSPEGGQAGGGDLRGPRRMETADQERHEQGLLLGDIGKEVSAPLPQSGENVSDGRIGVFLDRDGTLNEEASYIRSPEELHLIRGAGEAVQRLNSRGFITCVMSNQSGVARGYLTEKDLISIHAKLERELARSGGRVDRMYYCPHHPTEGTPPYNIECDCRKPKTGMLLRGQEEFKLDLARSFVVGDSVVDMQAGNTVRAKTILVLTGYGAMAREQCRSAGVHLDHVAPTIVEAVDFVLDTVNQEEMK